MPNVFNSHLLHTLILETGLVCSTAKQIESASQLKHRTYLIRPVIRGHALLPLHNTLSMFVTSAPQGSVESIVISLIVNRGQLHFFLPFLLSFSVGFCYCQEFSRGRNTKVHITHIITNAYYVNAHTADHSERGAKRYVESPRIHLARD